MMTNTGISRLASSGWENYSRQNSSCLPNAIHSSTPAHIGAQLSEKRGRDRNTEGIDESIMAMATVTDE